MSELASNLETTLALIEKAMRGPWAVINERAGGECLLAFGTDKLAPEQPGPYYSTWTCINPADGHALVAAVNFLREHGAALQQAVAASASTTGAQDLLLAAEQCASSAQVVRDNKFRTGVTAADHPRMDARIAELERAERTCRSMAAVGPIAQADCYVAEMQTSAGTDFYVTVAVGARETTPSKFRERWKAEYEVAVWNHVLNGAPEPDLLAHGPPEGIEADHGTEPAWPPHGGAEALAPAVQPRTVALQLSELLAGLSLGCKHRDEHMNAAVLDGLRLTLGPLHTGPLSGAAVSPMLLEETSSFLIKLAAEHAEHDRDSDARMALTASTLARTVALQVERAHEAGTAEHRRDADLTAGMCQAMAAIDARFRSAEGLAAREAPISRMEFDALSAYLERYDHDGASISMRVDATAVDADFDRALERLEAAAIRGRPEASEAVRGAYRKLRGLVAQIRTTIAAPSPSGRDGRS